MIRLLALALPLFAAQASPHPAWDVAPRWACTMDRLRICSGTGGRCEIQPNTASFRIDFAEKLFGVAIEPSIYPQASAASRAPHDYNEQIVARTWIAPHGQDPGFAKVALDSGDSFTLSGVPGTGETRAAILTRSQLDSQYLFYGSCSPTP